MQKRVEDLTVTKSYRANKEYFVLHLTSESGLPSIEAGQFAEVQVKNSSTTFLRRPISIYDCDPESNQLMLLIQEVGDGTKQLAKIKPGDSLNLVYPLGSSFSINNQKKALLVGGGVGTAPMLILGKTLKSKGIEPVFLFGARNKDLLIDLATFNDLGKVEITTEDGSYGLKGRVTDHSLLNESINDFDMVYTCGPNAMMKAVAQKCTVANIECEVSLENMMACGFGACLCCVVDTHEGNKCTCTEGPVFNIKDLKGWQ